MRFVLFALFVILSASTGVAEKLPLSQISSYLNSLRTVEGEFTQINEDGSIATGKLYIKRPGKMRFEYNPPEQTLVVVGNNAVVIYDGRSNERGETYPLRRTPLSIILANQVNLSRADMVTDHGFDGTATTVRAQDPERPEIGSIELKFTADPVELRQWIIRDSNGGQTTVILGEKEIGKSLPNRLFNPDRP